MKGDPEGGREMPMGAKVLGYLSAVLYLAARVPQIVKNAREGSCEGMYYVRLCWGTSDRAAPDGESLGGDMGEDEG